MPTRHDSTAMRVAAALRSGKTEIIDRWRRRVLGDPEIRTANELSEPLFLDHVPGFVDELIETLEDLDGFESGREAGRMAGRTREARTHAQFRFQCGYSLQEVIKELLQLQRVLFEVCHELGADPAGNITTLFISAIGGAMTVAANELGSELALHTLEHELELKQRILLEVEGRYRSLFGSNIVGMVICDMRGGIKEANDAFLQMVGFAREDLEGGCLNWRVITPPGALPLDEMGLEELVRTGQARPFEKEFLTKDGARVRAMIGVALALGGREGICFALDVTARHRAEEARRASEERLRLMVDGVKDYALFMLDAPGHIVSWNEGAERITGYRAEEILGRHSALLHPQEELEEDPDEDLRLAEQKGNHEYEGLHTRKDGSHFWASESLTALRDPDGQLRGFAVVLHDASERKQRELELEQLVQKEQAAREAAEVAEQEARQAVRGRDEFIGIASHELKNPIMALDLQAHVLRRNLDRLRQDGLDVQRLDQMVEGITRHSRKLVFLVDHLLDVSRISSGQLELEPSEVDLVQVVRSVAERLEDALKRAGCSLLFESEGPVIGHWDQLRLEQVMTNLLTNSIKYAPGSRIEVRVEREGGIARLSVRDYGKGIAPDNQEKIFRPFERATTIFASQSLGLGLYITQQIVKAHGGTVRVESEEGEGATFTVELPLEPPPRGEVRANP